MELCVNHWACDGIIVKVESHDQIWVALMFVYRDDGVSVVATEAREDARVATEFR